MADKKREAKVLAEVTGKSAELAKLIEYAADAVVSKTLLDKEAGTVTLFAFDEGQKLSEHQAPFDAMVQVVDGEGTFFIGGEEVNCKAGEVLVMPANVPHSVLAGERFKMLLTMIRG